MKNINGIIKDFTWNHSTMLSSRSHKTAGMLVGVQRIHVNISQTVEQSCDLFEPRTIGTRRRPATEWTDELQSPKSLDR